MDFFDKMGEKLVSTGAEVSKKAKEVSAVISLKNKIHAEENKISEIYRSIGEKYFLAHQEYEGDIYADDIASVFAAKAGIETMKEQIKEIKGTEICPECGAEVESDAAFCFKCGAKIRKE